MALRALGLLLCLTLSGARAAVDAYEFPDPAMQQRYESLVAELRCPQCLNTNLAGSDAIIARDLRREVHRLLLEGHTDREVLDFMRERYGDFILYEPRVNRGTLLLWFGPLVFLLIAGIAWYRLTRRRRAATGLSPEEQARLDALLGDRE